MLGTFKRNLQSDSLQIHRAQNLKPLVPNDKLVFGKTFTDHMVSIDWSAADGWNAPQILPYSDISISPSSTVFHYGMACFEGMKVFRKSNGKLLMFRPDMNMARLNASVKRIGLPEIDGSELVKIIAELVRIDERWVPTGKGFSLYIRPVVFGTQAALGVGPTDAAKVIVMMCPVGPYYPTGFKPVTLLAQSEFVRAWPGGTGNCKVGGNYAPTIPPQVEAQKLGCQQILWLFGPNDELTEVGTMNLFVFLKSKNRNELVTPPLSDGTILPGVTRDSILQITKNWGEFDVVERSITMPEVQTAIQENRILEMFGSGTAATVCPIKAILYKGQTLTVPLDPTDLNSGAGPLTRRINEVISDIQYGKTKSEWSVEI